MKRDTNNLVVLDGLRTPFAPAHRHLRNLPADELARQVCRRLMLRHPDLKKKVAEVIFGCVGPTATQANISRIIALRSGLDRRIPALTVQRNCASGMEAAAQVFHRRPHEEDEIFLVGGCESMSHYPFIYPDAMKDWLMAWGSARDLKTRWQTLVRFRPTFLKPRVALLEGLRDPVCGLSMGRTAENLAREFGITREEQDAFALRSHERASAARQRLAEETVCVVGPDLALRDDAAVRPGQSLEALAGLQPVFTRNLGTVTAGNACGLSDGAAALLVAREGGLTQDRPVLGRIRDYVVVGLAPERMGLGPVHAMAKLLQRHNLTLTDIDLIEINEAFAAQVLACTRASASAAFGRRELGLKKALGEIDPERLNVNGGAIALGHPLGASGTRIVLTLLKELNRRQLKLGLAAMCIGGGQGMAMLLEGGTQHD